MRERERERDTMCEIDREIQQCVRERDTTMCESDTLREIERDRDTFQVLSCQGIIARGSQLRIL